MSARLSVVSLCLLLGACASVPQPGFTDIASLARSGKSPAEIIAVLDASAGVYPLTAGEIAQLAREGVPEAVLDHMLAVWLEQVARRAYWDGQLASNFAFPRAYPLTHPYLYPPRVVGAGAPAVEPAQAAAGAQAVSGQVSATPVQGDAAVSTAEQPGDTLTGGAPPVAVEPVGSGPDETAAVSTGAASTAPSATPAEPDHAPEPVASQPVASSMTNAVAPTPALDATAVTPAAPAATDPTAPHPADAVSGDPDLVPVGVVSAP